MQGLFKVNSLPFAPLAAALVYKHLVGDFVRFRLVFDKIDLKLMAQKIGHRLVYKLVGNRLFGLVFVGGDGRKGGNHQHKAFLNVRKGNLTLV